MGPSTRSVRIAVAAFMCIGTIEIVEAILLGSIPSPPDTDGSASCTHLLTILLLFLKSTHACFKCFTSIATFFTLSTKLLLPTEMFLLCNSAAVILGAAVDAFIYLNRLQEDRLPPSEYGCVPGTAKAVAVFTLARRASLMMSPTFYVTRVFFAMFLGVVQLLIIREVNVYYETTVLELEAVDSPTKSGGETASPDSPLEAVPDRLVKKGPVQKSLKPEACAIPAVSPQDKLAGALLASPKKKAAAICPKNTPDPEHKADSSELKRGHKQ